MPPLSPRNTKKFHIAFVNNRKNRTTRFSGIGIERRKEEMGEFYSPNQIAIRLTKMQVGITIRECSY